jgi:imidazole glycerol-phosphate synthase subunit HisH
MITIIDYGLGNIQAFVNVYRRLDIDVRVARTSEDVASAERIILPGVGAFDHAMELLQKSGMRESLDAVVAEARAPVLGICVGMQILASSSEEGKLRGLSWIDGSVRKLDVARATAPIRLPHMGWNDVAPMARGGLFAGLEDSARFYFLHSYYFACAERGDELAQTDYGGAFASAVRREHIYGVQFHPEKSHHFGVRLLQNFAEL